MRKNTIKDNINYYIKMDYIHEANDSFRFDKLHLTKPTPITGGNYFIKFLVGDMSLYIQPPKCKLKDGITKAGKKLFADLVFNNENEQFIRWIENLENYSQEIIYKNREAWFDGGLEKHDIENYFTSPLKIYKSGKYYTVRTNVVKLKIYDENECEVNMESLNDSMNVMTILEFQGIKCSSRNFQIEIEMKQMLVMKPTNIFEKCLLKPKNTNQISNGEIPENKPIMRENITMKLEEDEYTAKEERLIPVIKQEDEVQSETVEESFDKHTEIEDAIDEEVKEDTAVESINETVDKEIEEPEKEEIKEIQKDETPVIQPTNLVIKKVISNGLEEVNFPLESLPDNDVIHIKTSNEVYYEMYREARRKAKIARNLALSSYLEAKRIKNTYMLEDIDDSEESDLDLEDLENENDENNKNESE
jgi:hypothetical protein